MIKVFGGQPVKPDATLDESELAHAISVAFGVTPERADGYVDGAFARNLFSGKWPGYSGRCRHRAPACANRPLFGEGGLRGQCHPLYLVGRSAPGMGLK